MRYYLPAQLPSKALHCSLSSSISLPPSLLTFYCWTSSLKTNDRRHNRLQGHPSHPRSRTRPRWARWNQAAIENRYRHFELIKICVWGGSAHTCTQFRVIHTWFSVSFSRWLNSPTACDASVLFEKVAHLSLGSIVTNRFVSKDLWGEQLVFFKGLNVKAQIFHSDNPFLEKYNLNLQNGHNSSNRSMKLYILLYYITTSA